MSKKEVAILDFGSSKLSVLIGAKGINNTYKIKGSADALYDGFTNGEFFDEQKLNVAIKEAISKVQINSNFNISKIYVGVPAEFCYSTLKQATIPFQKRKKINDDDIYLLFDEAEKMLNDANNFVINRSPIYFVMDDNRKVVNPNGMKTSKLSGNISFVVAEAKFVKLVYGILKEMDIEQVEFVSSVLAESLFLLEPEIRDNYAVIIDCGYLTTSVAWVQGDGIISLKAFSIGGGHITADISQCLNVNFKDAETLKRKAVLSLDATDTDIYQINVDGTSSPYSAKLVNEIITARLEMIAKTINKCLNSVETGSNAYYPIYLTGGGISLIKGGKDFLSKSIGKNIELLTPNLPELNRPNLSSELSVLDMALKQEKASKNDFLKKIFGRK